MLDFTLELISVVDVHCCSLCMSSPFISLLALSVLDAQAVLFLFNLRLVYSCSMFSSTLVAHESAEDSSDCFELALPPMGKSSFQQRLLMNLLSNILLPSHEHGARLACIIPQEVIPNLSVSLSGSESLVLLKSCFLLHFNEVMSAHFLSHVPYIVGMAMLLALQVLSMTQVGIFGPHCDGSLLHEPIHLEQDLVPVALSPQVAAGVKANCMEMFSQCSLVQGLPDVVGAFFVPSVLLMSSEELEIPVKSLPQEPLSHPFDD